MPYRKQLRRLKYWRLNMPSQERSLLKTIGVGLMGFGEGMTGAPYLSNYQKMQAQAQQDKMQRDLEQQKMEADLIKGGNYPINPSVQPPGGFDQNQMFSFNNKPYMKAPEKQNYVPAYMMGPDGSLVPVISPNNPPGMVPKGSKVIPNPNAPTTDMRNQGVSASQARILWDDLKSQSEGLKGGYAGLLEKGKAIINRGSGDSANYKLYIDSLPSSAVALYRVLTGDTRLSDADAKARALPLLWEPSESTDLRDKKNSFIDRMIVARERLLNSGKYSDGVIPLSDISKEAKKESSSKSDDIRTQYNNLRQGGMSAEEAKKKLGL